MVTQKSVKHKHTHFVTDEVSKYREGVVTKTNSKTKSVIVDVGLKKDCHVSDPTNKLSEGLRVTVELDLARCGH